MALPSKYGIDKKINSMEGLSAYENGGKGSGNFGHSGRPGEVGGSAPIGASSSNDKTKDDDKKALSGLEKELYEKKQVKIDRIKEKIGKDIDLTADDLSNDPWRDLRYITVTDKDGEEYSYDAISEQVHKRSSGEEMLAPSVKKALADKDELWKKPSWEIKGQEVKKKLKEYGINTDGLSVSRKSAGYSDAWYVEGSGKKTDLKSAERIIRTKLEDIDRDERTGEILLGGNAYVFVTDTDRNSFSDEKNLVRTITEKIDNLEKLINGGKGSGNFGHAGRPGEVGGSGDGGASASDTKKGSKNDPDKLGLTKRGYKYEKTDKGFYVLQQKESGEDSYEDVMTFEKSGKMLRVLELPTFSRMPGRFYKDVDSIIADYKKEIRNY